jgi:hypothetical protein
MDIEKYLSDRVEDQLDYYEGKRGTSVTYLHVIEFIDCDTLNDK